jgi:hypothetical protein
LQPYWIKTTPRRNQTLRAIAKRRCQITKVSTRDQGLAFALYKVLMILLRADTSLTDADETLLLECLCQGARLASGTCCRVSDCYCWFSVFLGGPLTIHNLLGLDEGMLDDETVEEFTATFLPKLAGLLEKVH